MTDAGPSDNVALARARLAKFNTETLTMMKLLIDNGADVNSMSSGGSTPLSNAITKVEVPRVKLLLERGAVAGDIVSALERASLYVSRIDDEQLRQDLSAIRRLLVNNNLIQY